MRRPNARGEPKEQTLAPAPAAAPSPSPTAPTKMGAQRRQQQPASHRRVAGALALLAASALALLLLASRSAAAPRYGVVIDAGSTGSRVHVIAYRAGAGAALPQLDWARTASLKANPGLSSFAADPRGAGLSLAPLVDYARRRVPRERWAETEVRLMATAGLRLLDAAVAESVLESCRDVLRQSGFLFQDRWATVISGMLYILEVPPLNLGASNFSTIVHSDHGSTSKCCVGAEEGIYAWVAANYALGTLGGDPHDTTGIIELGGASVQVTFVTGEPLPPEYSHVLKFGDVSYNLYSHSFLQLGLNVAYESLHDMLSSPGLKSIAAHLITQTKYKDPCTPRGFTRMVGSAKLPVSVLEPKVEYRPFAHAVGNFSECRSAALTLLQRGKEGCAYHECRLGAAFVPELEGKFLATENFYHTSKFFGLHSKSFLSDLMVAGEKFCHGDWSNIKKKYSSFDEGELLLFCFSSAYIIALLHDTLKMSLDHKRIDVVNQIHGVPVDWALGAFIVQTTMNRTEYSDSSASYLSSYDSSGLAPLFLITTVVAFTAFSILRWRRPQLKTIYDMEKGRVQAAALVYDRTMWVAAAFVLVLCRVVPKLLM
ncbi:putative apyrase 6 [Dichanthelium oligosanthes]|uniref:Putative apyrase 6 n=1 Tax=Dichanthelium oligosanthes TaxID=888268 RepID=A0A1E5W9Y1_9POAL|nr:putative apyrase 6 [Dichanthelium oligosanthes]